MQKLAARRFKKHLVRNSVVVVCAVTAIAVITVAILSHLLPAVQSAKTASEVVSLFEEQAPSYLESNHYKKVEKPTNTLIRYSGSSSSGYELSIAPDASAQYTKTDTSIQKNDGSMVIRYEELLNRHGLTQTTSNDNVTGYLLKIFENDQVVCQTSDWQRYGNTGASYGIACIDKANVINAYEATDSLLTIAADDINRADISVLTRSDITMSASATLATLVTKQRDGSSLTLYFLHAQNKWEYIGARPTPNVDDKESFFVPQKLIDTINSSEEKELLTRYILGGGAL